MNSLYLYKLKKSPRKYKPEFGQNDNFADTVKKIFLYNNNKNSKHIKINDSINKDN